MKFFTSFGTVLIGLVASVVASPVPQAAPAEGLNKFTFPVAGTEKFNDGVPVEIRWNIAGNPSQVKLVLMRGQTGAMTHEVQDITGPVPNSGYFSWTPSKSLQDSDAMNGEKYGIKIVEVDSGAVNYSPEFAVAVVGSTYVPTASAASSAPVAATSAAAIVPASVSSSAPVSSAPASATDALRTTPAPATTGTPAATTSASAATSAASKTSDATTSAPASTKAPASDDKDDKESSGPNIGAIIGGVFGGVAVIALIALGLIIFFRRRKDWQRERALKNLDREHALHRVSEIQEAYRREQDAKMGPVTRSDTLRTTTSNVSHISGQHHLSVTGGSYPPMQKKRESEKGTFGTAF